MSVQISADPADIEQRLSRWRSAVAGVLAKSTRRDPSELPAEPERLLDSPTYEGFPVRPLYTSLDTLAEPPLPGSGPSCGAATRCATSSRDGRWPKGFPANGSAAVGEDNGAVLVALTEGVSALVLRVGEPGGVAAGRPGPAARGRLPRPGAGGTGRGHRLRCRRRRGAGAADRAWTTTSASRLSVDLGADPLTAPLGARSAPERGRRRRDRGESGRLRRTACARSPLTARRSTTTVRARRGSWPAAWQPGWPTCGCSAAAALVFGMGCGRSAFDSPRTTTSS